MKQIIALAALTALAACSGSEQTPAPETTAEQTETVDQTAQEPVTDVTTEADGDTAITTEDAADELDNAVDEVAQTAEEMTEKAHETMAEINAQSNEVSGDDMENALGESMNEALQGISGMAQNAQNAVEVTSEAAGVPIDESYEGTLTGNEFTDYEVTAIEGHTMKVALQSDASAYFNVLPPDSQDEAIFTGSQDGETFEETLEATGAYTVRVYLMGADRDGTEPRNYVLDIDVSRE